MFNLTKPYGGMISRITAASSGGAYTDTQFFFGSQFWPENSQGNSQDVSLSSRNSQQSSEVKYSSITNIES